LIRPWLVWNRLEQELVDGNVGDAIVTANVVTAARRLGVECTTLAQTLDNHVATQGVEGIATVYYDSLPLRAYYLARAGVPVAVTPPDRAALLARQQPDGSWPADPWFTDRLGQTWRSRMFSTAFALEVLMRFGPERLRARVLGS